MTTTRVEHTDAEIEDWIDGATFVQVKVDIHRNPALWADLGPLYARVSAAEDRLAEAQAAAADRRQDHPDDTLGGSSPGSTAPPGEGTLAERAPVPPAVAAAQADLDALVAEATALYDRYDADKETWVLRGLDVTEAQAIVAAQDRPPVAPPVRRPKEGTRAYRDRQAAYVDQVTAYKVAIDEAALALAVVEVIVRGEHMPPPSVEGLRRVRTRPHGSRHWAALVSAMESLTTGEVSIPAPHRHSAGA